MSELSVIAQKYRSLSREDRHRIASRAIREFAPVQHSANYDEWNRAVRLRIYALTTLYNGVTFADEHREHDEAAELS